MRGIQFARPRQVFESVEEGHAWANGVGGPLFTEGDGLRCQHFNVFDKMNEPMAESPLPFSLLANPDV
jgi:hypothetical protein